MSTLRKHSGHRGPVVDIVGALAVLGGVYLLFEVALMRLLVIPGYLLVASATLVRNTVLPGLSGTAWRAFLVGYVVSLAVLFGVVSYRIRTTR